MAKKPKGKRTVPLQTPVNREAVAAKQYDSCVIERAVITTPPQNEDPMLRGVYFIGVEEGTEGEITTLNNQAQNVEIPLDNTEPHGVNLATLTLGQRKQLALDVVFGLITEAIG